MAKREPMTLKIEGSWEAVAEKMLRVPAGSTPKRETAKRKKSEKRKPKR